MFLSIHHILPNLLLNTKISLSESDLRDISVIFFFLHLKIGKISEKIVDPREEVKSSVCASVRVY